jgi:hypothetical protein
MITQLNKFLVLLFLVLCSSLQAVPAVIEPSSPSPASSGDRVCSLPSPSFFIVTGVGPTWAKLSWSAVPGATAYHIITTEVATGNVVDNSTVPASINSLTVNNLTPGTDYESRIWSVCSDGTDGSTYTSTFLRTIILDLVILGYQEPSGCLQQNCELLIMNEGCDFTWATNATTYFKIVNKSNGAERYFMLKTPTNSEVVLYPDNTNNSGFVFQKVGDQAIKIRYQSVGFIARISASRHSLVGWLFRDEASENDSGFQIFRLGTCNQGRPGGSESWGGNDMPTEFVVASPNPFTDQLDVQVNFLAETEQVMLRLFDQQGRQVILQQLPGGLEKYSLPTAELPPGVYFLRVESAGQTQTIKVVKTR